jgi:hypothetical protein
MSIVASASAAVTPITKTSCHTAGAGETLFIGAKLSKPVNGSLTVKKLSQSVPLKGGTFGGRVGICLENSGSKLTGSITEGTIVIPPFTSTLKILGREAEFGIEITQFGPGEGTLKGEVPPFVVLNVQAEANIAFTTIKILNLTVPTKCKTVEPIHLPFVKELTLLELLSETTITGVATMPPVSCEGPAHRLESAVLTALFSGPGNPYSLTFGAGELTEIEFG